MRVTFDRGVACSNLVSVTDNVIKTFYHVVTSLQARRSYSYQKDSYKKFRLLASFQQANHL